MACLLASRLSSTFTVGQSTRTAYEYMIVCHSRALADRKGSDVAQKRETDKMVYKSFSACSRLADALLCAPAQDTEYIFM